MPGIAHGVLDNVPALNIIISVRGSWQCLDMPLKLEFELKVQLIKK